MDQWARKSVQKLCMLVCQKIIRPRQALRTQRYNTLRLEFVSYNRIRMTWFNGGGDDRDSLIKRNMGGVFHIGDFKSWHVAQGTR